MAEIDTDKARGGTTTPRHVVTKMLAISTALAAVALFVVLAVS
ncbi:hypothetical protein [Stappia albiluteola]|nr:hypothetical protein [Stappia albiluteola]